MPEAAPRDTEAEVADPAQLETVSRRRPLVLPGLPAETPAAASGLPEIAAEVAHDLRNALQAIIHQAELLQGQAPTEEMRQRLAVVLRTATGGSHMLNRLRRAAGPEPAAPAGLVSISQILQDAAEITRFRWGRVSGDPRPPIAIEFELHEMPRVRGNPGELTQVFTNLIVNACEALGDGGVIRLGARHDGTHAVATVGDDGPGMSEETRARIFGRSFSTKGADNSGLGLSIAADIIGRHQGHVLVESTPGRGTTFFVLLHSDPDPEPALAGQSPPLRILLVEDDASARESLSSILRGVGHEVRAAASGREAIVALSQPCDALLTDFSLGDMTGEEVSRVARHRQPRARVILMTGWDADRADPEHFADLVLTKPVRVSDILAALHGLSE